MGQHGHGDVVEEPLAEGLGAGTAGVAVEHAQQHAACLQQGGRTATVLDRSVGRQLIAVKAHHWTKVLAIKLGDLEAELIGFQDAVDLEEGMHRQIMKATYMGDTQLNSH